MGGRRTEAQRKKNSADMRRWRAQNPERSREINRAYRARHGDKCRHRTREWAAKNPIALKRIKFALRLKKYGIDVEDWARMFHAQDGRCPGCRVPLRDGWHTAIDHCHHTGHFRGLLCIRCNRSIGVLLESPETLRRLAAFIEAHR